MIIDGALIKEQGITFAIIVVKPFVLSSTSESENMRNLGVSIFSHIPIILMAQDSQGRATFQGRKDIVNFLVNIPLSSIPFRRYTVQ